MSCSNAAVPPNTALLTDAFHSALRAARGAAKRERWAANSRTNFPFMGYDQSSFQKPQLLTAVDLLIPEATFHLRLSRKAWVACSILTARASIAHTPTVRLLQEISPPHDFTMASDDLYSVPLGYAPGPRLLTAFSEFLSNTKRAEDWRGLIAFEPLGFLIYGRWTTDGGELLVQDARVSIVNTVFGLPNSRVSDWRNALDQLAALLPMAHS
jgi:hypothetical protein